MQVDLITEPRWTRNRTTFTENPQWAAAITRAMVLGYQGPSVGFDSVAEVIKHFPGDGSVLRGKDPHDAVGQFAVYPTTGSLFTYQVPAFQAAVDAGVSAIMRDARRLRQRGGGTEADRDGDGGNPGDRAESAVERHIVSFR